jgi:hypothetical protein
MAIVGQNPRPADSGRFLQKESVSGLQVAFVNPSNIGAGVLTLQATGDASNRDMGTFSITFNYTVDNNVYPFDSIIAWNYVNFYIDGSGVGPGFETNLYRIGTAVSGTTAPLRKPMLIDIFPQFLYAPAISSFSANSHANIWYCKNNDSSSHVIGAYSFWKYIVTGGLNG